MSVTNDVQTAQNHDTQQCTKWSKYIHR